MIKQTVPDILVLGGSKATLLSSNREGSHLISLHSEDLSSRINPRDKLFQRGICFIIVNLAGSGIGMSAAAIFKHQLPDIGFGTPVENGFTDRILLFQAPHNMNGNIALRVNRVNHKAVSGIDGIVIS